MSTITLAAIRMDATPEALESRLTRAERLVTQAAAAGAQIAVLPELFNLGYVYHPANHHRAETLTGPTFSWMQDTARRLRIYLAGSFLLRAEDGIYNSMFLVAPQGAFWRYDKTYPWFWERAYFRPRRQPICPAETEFGRIGMLICWDTAHPELWAAYAGKVQLILVSSCPPLEHQMRFLFPDGRVFTPADFGPLMRAFYRNSEKLFGEYFLRQSAWLGVPAVNTTGGGTFRSSWPRPYLTFALLLAARPDLWRYLPQAQHILGEAGYYDATFIADAQGIVRGRAKGNGDDLTVATVALPAASPTPRAPQPPIPLPRITYWADALINALMASKVSTS